MIPYIKTGFGKIPTYVIMVVLGALCMLFVTHIMLKSSNNRENEEVFIFPKIVISGFFGLFFAGVCDSVFKYREYHSLKITGITFYGGLIGAVICISVLIKKHKEYSQYFLCEWLDLLTPPLIVFHIFGRLGCFFGGCCYGKTTNGILGVSFLDDPDNNIFHYGNKCYPTQLFEISALIIILVIIVNVNKRFELYLFLYAVARFFIEFFRGDDRGYIIKALSPAQLISLLIVVIMTIRTTRKILNHRITRQ